MKKTTCCAVALLSVLATLPAVSFALNPVIQTMYTADPAPVAGEATGARIEIRLGKLDGPLIGTVPVSGTGGEWRPRSARISGAAGVHDLVFVFRGAAGEELFKFDYWQFSQRDLPADQALTEGAGQK